MHLERHVASHCISRVGGAPRTEPATDTDYARLAAGLTSRTSTPTAAPSRSAGVLNVAGVVNVLRETGVDGSLTLETDRWPGPPSEARARGMARPRGLLG